MIEIAVGLGNPLQRGSCTTLYGNYTIALETTVVSVSMTLMYLFYRVEADAGEVSGK